MSDNAVESSGRDYLQRRYHNATVVMLAGWLAGLAVYGGSYLYAITETSVAAARAQAIWNNPKGIKASGLPDFDWVALLDLIKAKQQPTQSFDTTKREPVPEPNSPEKRKRARLGKARSDLIHQFLMFPDAVRASGAFVSNSGNDNWCWTIPLQNPDDAGKLGAEAPSFGPERPGPIRIQPGDLVAMWDTSRESYTDLQSVRDDMERRGRRHGIAITVIFSMPWLWYFMLARRREMRDASRGSH